MAAAARGQGEQVQRALVRSQSSGTIARQVRARKIVFMQQAAHIVPVALIQLTDFASDVMVIVQLATMDGAAVDWIVCALAVGISMPTAWLSFWMAHTRHCILNRRNTLMGCLLACGNLHVLYVGMMYVSATHAGAKARAENYLWLFNQLKELETAIESTVLGLVTAGAFFRTLNDGGSGLALFASSLALSLLSMAYGFFAKAVGPYPDSDPFTIRRKVSIGHRRPALFLCLLVHLCWGLAAFGCLAAAAGPWWWLGLAAMAAIGLLRGFLEGNVQSQPKTRANTAANFWFVLLIDYDCLYEHFVPYSQKVAFAAARRALLLGAAATAIVLNPSTAIAAVLGALFLADLLCSPHAFRIIGVLDWDPLSALLDRLTRPAAPEPDLVLSVPPLTFLDGPEPGTVGSFVSADCAALLDMLDAITTQCAAPKDGGAAGAARPDGTDELRKEAEALRSAISTGALSGGQVVSAITAVGEYRPWEDDAQRLLVNKLRLRHSTVPAEPPDVRPPPKHPLRALPLAAGLTTEVWATKPSFFGSHPTGTKYELSEDAAHVDYFVRRRPRCPFVCHDHWHIPWSPPPFASSLTACAGEPRVARWPQAQGPDAARFPLPRRASRADRSRGGAARRLPDPPRRRHLCVGALVSMVGSKHAAACAARPRAAMGGIEPFGRHAARVATVGALSAYNLAGQVLHRPVVAGDDCGGHQLVRHLSCRLRQHGRLRQLDLLFAAVVGYGPLPPSRAPLRPHQLHPPPCLARYIAPR